MGLWYYVQDGEDGGGFHTFPDLSANMRAAHTLRLGFAIIRNKVLTSTNSSVSFTELWNMPDDSVC